MDRLPSGTLVGVGPVLLTQESWNDNKDRLNTAATLAHSSLLRVCWRRPHCPRICTATSTCCSGVTVKVSTVIPVDLPGVVIESGDL